MKRKVYRTCIRPAMLYGMETVPVTKYQERKFEVAEMSMLRFTLRLTRKDKVRNKRVREILGVRRFGEKAREWRFRWYGHVRRREEIYVGKRMLGMQPPGEEAERTAKAEVHGPNKRIYERVRTVRRRHKEPGEVETTHPLWRPLKQGEGRKLNS